MQILKKKLVAVLTCASALFLTACGPSKSEQKQLSTVKKGNSSETPTFFFHGWGSSVNAEKQMVNYARRHGVTNSVATLTVHKNGKVSVSGTWKKNAQNPIAMVGYSDNKNGNYHRNGYYAYQAVKAMQKKYHFKKMNVVGHSMGNMDIMYMLLDYSQQKSFPSLQHQVAIAGHFNGIRGMDKTAYSKVDKNGKPSQMNRFYKELLKMRQIYPKTASVMNIYGDLLDGTHSDKDVTTYSAKTLKYLTADRAKHYEEHLIKGKNAQHSKLHENKQVDRLLVRFLWGK